MHMVPVGATMESIDMLDDKTADSTVCNMEDLHQLKAKCPFAEGACVSACVRVRRESKRKRLLA